jgi:CO/xanthine dehydrogenase Mo-binding subunit
MKDISTPIKKVDSDDKATGKAKYVADIHMEGELYAKTLRSPHSKAKITKRLYPTVPEGYYIIDYRDIPGNNFVKIIQNDWVVFAEETVNYYLEPIALVIGPDKAIVTKLLEDIKIDYEILEPTFDYSDSIVHYHFNKGDIQWAKNHAEEVIEEAFETPYQEQLYMEPQGMIGYFDQGQIVLIGSMQCPYYIKNALINTLGCSDDYVRVIQPTIGGAFGGKEEFPSLIACQVAVAVEKIKKPIRLIYEREEDMQVTTKRHPSKIILKAFIKDKKIIGLESNVGIDGGAYLGLSGVVLSRALIASTGVYTVDNLDVSGDVYRTNTVPNGAFRGFGAPQMFFAIEMFFHHIGIKLYGKDSLVLRQKQLAKQGDKTSTNGTFRDPIIMDEMLQKALSESNYLLKRKQYNSKDVYKGIGMSWSLHGCGFTGSGEAEHIKALIKLEKTENDHVYIRIAAVDMGQGIQTTMRKLVAQILDLDLEQVHFDYPDTNLVPDSGPTVASRTMMIVGGLVARAARRLKEHWKPGEAQIEYERYKQPEYIKWDEETFQGDAYPAYSWAINIVEVEVNPISYEVHVKEMWSVYDVGKAIDEQIIKGQAEGGQLQALGYGYLERMTVENGKVRHKNVTDYIIPTTMDTPKMHTYLMDNPYPLGPYGAKGAGELTLIGGASAVSMAIEQAIGHNVQKIPVTPEYIMELMQDD